MIYLIIVSVIWAASFSIIKGTLTGVNPFFVSFLRLLISMLVFIPFLRVKNIDKHTFIKLTLTGSVQFGFMYITYIYAFQFLKAYEIALFTIVTPLYVTLLNDFFSKKFALMNFLTAILAIVGALIISYTPLSSPNLIKGFVLVQFSNICFAFGQIFYKKIQLKQKDSEIFAIPYLGAVLVASIFTGISGNFNFQSLTGKEVTALLYLGVIASGLSFFLWNIGAKKVSNGVLAVFNNLKIPLGMLVAVFVLKENIYLPNLIIGSLLIGFALWGSSKFDFSGKSYSK